ncbi:hypothetical protein B4099_3670 [Heyndrickxia coagulans]|uniref:Uncharacterized protein n=1 Tax=Heyndrickxia coagulans TaxID=1398 RepID=A0A150KHI1_HEYCO|nr:hypothetical protein B4099_3670 [Heyndrickxia coagulans]
MTRRVVEHRALSKDREELVVITVYEEGLNKERIRKDSIFSKKHAVLVKRDGKYDWK